MEYKADKGKHKTKQSEQKQEKNVSNFYIGNLIPGIKKWSCITFWIKQC